MKPLDLSTLPRVPLMRAMLMRFDDEEHWLVLTLHHITADGWSMGVLSRELRTLYTAFSVRPAVAAPRTARAICGLRRLAARVAARRAPGWRSGSTGAHSWRIFPPVPLWTDRPARRHGGFSRRFPEVHHPRTV